jgi:hypothetical protein
LWYEWDSSVRIKEIKNNNANNRKFLFLIKK